MVSLTTEDTKRFYDLYDMRYKPLLDEKGKMYRRLKKSNVTMTKLFGLNILICKKHET